MPQVDPFYQPPEDFAAAEPGTILRSRPVQLPFLPVPAQSWQLLYRTTDLFDQPDVTVTTVILPEGARPDRPLVSHQLYEDSSGPQCVPSYELQQADAPVTVAGMQMPYYVPELRQGWVVSVPDVEGRFGHFGVAKEPGYMVLDGIRAAQRFGPLGLNPHTKVGLAGYSAGGLSTGWTAQMAPSYAPEINLAGATMGGPVPDLAAVMVSVDDQPTSGQVGMILASLAAAYPEFGAVLGRHLTPAGSAVVDEIRSECASTWALTQLGPHWSRYLDMPLDQFLTLPTIKETLDSTTLGAPAPTAPLYVYQGVADQWNPVAATDRMVDNYCAAGTPVTYTRSAASKHLHEGLGGNPAALAWLQERLDTDTPAPSRCSTSNVP
ncbi:lipase family protein [Nocardia pseudobrasiliensis]|nr:lipase family protein [Nocardia pseudobrasiliensis]